MEELLLDVIKESNGPKGAHLRETCQHAYDLLCSQQGTTRDPSYELRRVCFIPLQIALETKRPKLVSLALNGFHKILRDDRFHKGNEPEDDSLWLPSQLLCATSSMAYHCQETQIHILRVLLALGIRNGGALNGRLVLWVAGRCAEAAAAPPVAAAARAAAAMTIRAFCLSLDEECQEILSENSLVKSKISAAACFSEIIPIMQYLCSRLCETQLTTKANVTAIFFLECLLTLVTSLPEIVNSNTHFTNFLWQKFCPALISFLGTPRVDKNIKSRDEGHSVDDSGRGSGSLASAPSFNSQQAKSVYSIASQLIRLVGCIGSLRPVLEALYHRMLLYPPISHRAEALASTKDLLKDPKKICSLLMLKQPNSIIDQHSDEMALIRLIMDAIEESASSSNPNILLVSLECVVGFLEAIEDLCDGKFIPQNASEINNKWQKLEDADYRGPLTYQSLARLPSPYRDLVAEMQSKIENEASDSSHTSGPEDNSIGSEGELDSDADSVFLPSRPHHNYQKDSNEYLGSQNESSDISGVKRVPRTLNLGRCNITDYNVDVERQNARQFIKTLQNVMVPKLLSFRTCIEVDESMQDFASKCCQYNASRSPSSATIMNADGIYLATYSALLLNLKLIVSGYYKNETTSIPLSEEEFVEEVQGSGVLVYLSATWLCEVYQQIITTSILEVGGFQPSSQEHNALVNLLMDFGGIGPSQVMCDWQRLKEVSMPNTCMKDNAEKMAALKLARRLLTCMWDSMVTLLSASLIGKYCKNGSNVNTHVNLHKLLSRKRFSSKKDKALDACVTLSLEGLHKAARISNTLRLQNRCSSLLALLSNTACSEPPSTKILSAHALSLDVLITGGLELGSHSVDCWKHIFSACQYVYRLEHTLFGQQCNTTTPLITLQTSRNKTISFTQNSSTNFLSERLHQSFNLNQNHIDDETCIDVYNFLQSNIENSATNSKMSVASIIQKCHQEANKSTPHGYICGTDAAKVCCALSQHVDALFSDAASKLNLPALCSFLEQLCIASEKQLCTEGLRSEQNVGRWWKAAGHIRTSNNLMNGGGLLSRVGEVTLQCLKAPRPLAHHMAVWTIVGPHFMKAACSKDRRISKKAIQCIHDAVTMLLNEQIELPHFHFNEALLKPFENLLCLELCDGDVQEQIISCICEFVEANQTEIKSGWRPLFGTLRAAHNSNQYSAVLEIFRVFLNTDNTLVFANAAVDCILCLLSYIRGANTDANNGNEIINEPDSPSNTSKPVFNLSQIFVNRNLKSDMMGLASDQPQMTFEICKESLRYIESCAEILGMMYSMPKCPTFNTAHRVNIDMPLQVVDALFPKSAIHVKQFTDTPDISDNNVISYRVLSTNLPGSQTIYSSLSKIDRPSGVLKVWHLLLDGLISASITCSQQFQAAALETTFKILQDMMVIPGPIFGLHTVNHLLLPAMQNWLRQVNKNDSTWGNFTPNFKQCCGLATDLIVRYLHLLQEDTTSSDLVNNHESSKNSDDVQDQHDPAEIKAVTFALKQLLLILVECISQPQEIIARLGASCIRHIILTSGNLLSQQQWEITCTSLHRACNASLTPLQQLTLAFEENSDSFYGDLAIVKVAARCDSSINDNVRLHSMSQQVFFYDYSKEHSINANSLQNHGRYQSLTQPMKNYVLTDDRSYIFLLYPQDAVNAINPDLHLIRISLKSLVMGLLAHQILVQIIATILLQQSSNIIPLNHILLDTFKATGLALNKKYNLNYRNLEILFKCLDMSYKRTISFDMRPGLKFLVQKVSNLENAANLYKHTTAAWIIKIMALTELLCLLKIRYASNETKHSKHITKIDLKNTWEMLCDFYINSIEVDSVAADLANSEKSISINEGTMNSLDGIDSSDCEQIIDEAKDSIENDINNSNEMVENSTDQDRDDPSPPKPFTFSDFRKESINFGNGINCDNNNDDDVSKHDTIEAKNKSPSYENLANANFKLSDSIKLDANDANGFRKMNKFNDSNSSIKLNNIRNNSQTDPILPAQPIPPEIEQERIHSIAKDNDAKRIAFANTLAAYLELILTFPDDEFEMIAAVLNLGLSKISEYATDSLLLQRIDAFANRKDTV